MAQLNDLIVTGSSRFLNKTYTSTADVNCITASSAVDATEHSAGTIGQALISDGDSVYWGNPQHADTADEAQHAISAATLDDTEFIEDNEPYLFRTALREAGDRVYEDAIVGGSVAWNQIVQNGDFASSNGWTGVYATISVANNVCTITPENNINSRLTHALVTLPNHKYAFFAMIKPSASTNVVWSADNSAIQGLPATSMSANVWNNYSAIGNANASSANFNLFVNRGTTLTTSDSVDVKNVYISDLTQMFGSTIADYAYTLEQSTAGSGVAWLKSNGFFTKDYYAYNAGGIESVKTSAKKVVGFNQWDEVTEIGGIANATGLNYLTSDRLRSKNYTLVLPNIFYNVMVGDSTFSYLNIFFYDGDKNFISQIQIGRFSMPATFETPINCKYIRFCIQPDYGTTYKNDICINFHWDGERDGEYEAYEEHTYPLDSDLELRGIPKLVDGKIKYDGDLYASDGTVTRKYGIVDLGTQSWEYVTNDGEPYFKTLISNRKYNVTSFSNLVCSKYATSTVSGTSNLTDKKIVGATGSENVFVRDTSYTDATTFKTAMSGVYLVYELKTPTTESADPYTNPQWVSNWGTEEFVDERDVPVPVGHESRYPKNDNYKLANIPAPPGSNGDYIVHTDKYGESVYARADNVKVNYAGTADLGKRRIFIEGTQTTSTTTGLWTGDASPYFQSSADLTDGQEITYWLPLPTTGNATLNLTFGDGTSSGAVNCYYGGTTRLTTHYGQGQAIHLTYRKNVKIPSTGTTTYTGWWADANYDSNSNNIDILQGTYTIPVAGATAGLKQYSLFAEDANGKYSSFTTQNGTAVSKTVNRTDYFDISKIYYCSTGGNYATNANIGTSIVRWAQPLVDLRYTLNIATASNPLTARKPLYLKFDALSTAMGTEGRVCYKLAGTGTQDWWTQTLPAADAQADGIVYVKVSEAAYDTYRADLSIKQKYFYINSVGFGSEPGFDAIRAIKADNSDYSESATYATNAGTATQSIYLQGTNCVTTVSSNIYSSAEGSSTTASGLGSHAEGVGTHATNTYAHAEGQGTWATSSNSHAEGSNTTAAASGAHAEGSYTSATGEASHVEGNYTKATGKYSHAEGVATSSVSDYSHAEGASTSAAGSYSHAEGNTTTAKGAYSHAEGLQNYASGDYSHAEGYKTTAAYNFAHAEGYQTSAYQTASHAEGTDTRAFGSFSHAEGSETSASATYTHAEGYRSRATDVGAHAEGYQTTACSTYAHSEGYGTSAAASYAHAEGEGTRASGQASHAEGTATTASGKYSHAEGWVSKATSTASHAEGYYTTASGAYSHASGCYTIANKDYQTVIGKYNSTVDNALFIVGDGTATVARSNAMYVTTAGEIYTTWLNGSVRSTPLSDGKFNRLVMPSYTTGEQLYPLQVEYGRTLSGNGIGTFGVLTNYNTYTVDLNIALTQQSNPYVFNATISYPTTMYSAPKFIFLIPRDKSTGVNSRVCYNNGYGIDRQPTNFPASSWADGKTSGVHQFYVAAGSAGTAYVTAIIGWR